MTREERASYIASFQRGWQWLSCLSMTDVRRIVRRWRGQARGRVEGLAAGDAHLERRTRVI
jgi:hypothetical protein